MSPGTLYRLSAFTTNPSQGNPAGVWVGGALPDAATMQRIAASVGFSETAFVVPTRGSERSIRYFSPEAEVAFCGHATIAAGVLLGELEGDGAYGLDTREGRIPVTVGVRDGNREASLTSVEPRFELAGDQLLNRVLASLGWSRNELDRSIPPARAYAGVWHLVLAASDAQRLASLDYDFQGLRAVMTEDGLTTLQLIWRETPHLFHSRNPFPVGGVVEDPATGAAAAALGGYLRDSGLVKPPIALTILQGETMGRASRLNVDVPVAGGIVVSGNAVRF